MAAKYLWFHLHLLPRSTEAAAMEQLPDLYWNTSNPMSGGNKALKKSFSSTFC